MDHITNPLPPLSDFAQAGRDALAPLPNDDIERLAAAAGGTLSDETIAAIGILLNPTNYIDTGRGLANETHPAIFMEEHEYFGTSISGYEDLAQILASHLNRTLAEPLRDRFRFAIECDTDDEGASMYSVAHRSDGTTYLATFENIKYIHPSGKFDLTGEFVGLLGAASALATIHGDYYALLRPTLR